MAPRANSGISGTASRPLSCWIARFPTWGPLPWTMTTRHPSSSSSQMERAMASACARCCSYVPASPSAMMALPPRATTAVPVTVPSIHRGGVGPAPDGPVRTSYDVGVANSEQTRRTRSADPARGDPMTDPGPHTPGIPPDAVARFTAAEALLYPLAAVDPVRYERAVSLTAELLPDLRRHRGGAAAARCPGPDAERENGRDAPRPDRSAARDPGGRGLRGALSRAAGGTGGQGGDVADRRCEGHRTGVARRRARPRGPHVRPVPAG